MTKTDSDTTPNFSYLMLKLLISILIIGLALPVAASAATHPNLLFSDISEVPGYQYSSSSPWNSLEARIINSADSSLSFDFSDPNWDVYNRVSYRSEFASAIGFAYQITKEQKYFDKARQALLNLDLGDVPYKTDRSKSLRGYSLTYDWIQSDLSSADDAIIRDKLALLADQAYRDLNDDGASRSYVTFADYHGQAYPNVAIAGLALEDYTNPNNIALSSGPKDWIKAGTEYLFISDELHTSGKPLIYYGFDEVSGKSISGSYKNYVIDDMVWWFQIYSIHYDRNIFDDYPASKQIATSELWETLPNGYMNNYVCSGNTLERYHQAIISLLNDQEKGEIIRYLDQTEGNTLLPYSYENNGAPTILSYCVYGNYNDINSQAPEWTSHLNEDAIYQVFRGDWEEDSDWLSLVTYNLESESNRVMAHHDQLGFEYYSKGDLLLADAGETKHILERYYGQYGVHHNGIEIEDPREPFDTSPWADSQARGIFKGDSAQITTPVTVETAIESPWMEGIATSATISNVIGGSWGSSDSLSSPIDYSRTILYPEDDYFVIFDRFDATEEWAYRNVFRPTSLSITPTESTAIGHVQGDLEIDSTAFNWLALPYKEETKTGITTNTLTWDTTNPYGNRVTLNIYSVPESEVIVTKHTGRIAGYGSSSEVYSPVVYLKSDKQKDLYRITVLKANYLNEEQKEMTEIPVTGNGNAIRVRSSANTDTIYSGKGDTSFDHFNTDANIVFFRTPNDSTRYYFLISGGSYLKKDQNDLITILKTNSGNEISVHIPQNTQIQIKKDGLPYTAHQSDKNSSVVNIYSDDSDSVFEIYLDGRISCIILPELFESSELSITSQKTGISGITKKNNLSEQKSGNLAYIFISCAILVVLMYLHNRKQ